MRGFLLVLGLLPRDGILDFKEGVRSQESGVLEFLCGASLPLIEDEFIFDLLEV